MGLRGDAKIELTTGPIEIATLQDKFHNDADFKPMALCWNGQNATLTRLLGVRRLGLEQVFDVELDDGSHLDVSPSSELVLKSGVTKSPADLELGESLLPLYLSIDAHGYPMYQIPGREAKRKLSRLAAEWKLGRHLDKGTYVEHIDGNKNNYHPDNLRITVNTERARRSYTTHVVKAFMEAQALFDECAAVNPKFASIAGKRRRRRRPRKTNHKVMGSTPGCLEQVFTVIAESECSLAVSGVFLSLPS